MDAATTPQNTSQNEAAASNATGNTTGNATGNATCTVELSNKALAALEELQQSMANQAGAYRAMSQHITDEANREALQNIAQEIADQARDWQRYTGKTMKADQRKVCKYERLARLFGFTFAAKLMEKHRVKLAEQSHCLESEIPRFDALQQKEISRDQQLFGLLHEKRLGYVGAMILGMNDAIVEITGTLAGLTLAMQNTRLIALSGLITGIAATLSMAASEYLAEKTNRKPDAAKSALYTGVAYFVTVVILLLPYLLLDNSLYLLAMVIMLVLVVVVLALFNMYTSIAQGTPFGKRFGQMCLISLGVAALTFVLGLAVKVFLGVDV